MENENSKTEIKAKEPYTEEDYEFLRSEAEEMYLKRFNFPPDRAKQRADLEVESLKKTFRQMPEFI